MKKIALFITSLLITTALTSQSEADKLYQNNEFEQALPLFEQLTRDNPGDYAYFEKYVLCLMQMKELAKAENAIAERLKTDRTNTDLYFLYGSFLSRQGRSEEADSIRQIRRKLQEEGYSAAPAAQWNVPPPPPPVAASPPPVVTAAVALEEEEPVKRPDVMPRFLHPDCDKLHSEEFRKNCSDKKMLEFVYSNLRYPAGARQNQVEGTAVVTFAVEKDGSMKDIRLVRDLASGCGEEALRVVNQMAEQGVRWSPGIQNGVPVRVQFNLPVRFKLP
jgi:TonB family protein